MTWNHCNIDDGGLMKESTPKTEGKLMYNAINPQLLQ